MILQRTGYETDKFFSNVALGITDGLDGALWSYVFATIIFSGALSVFVPVGLAIILAGWALVSIFVTLTSKSKIHVVAIDEQAVVIFGSIGLLLIGKLGFEASGSKGLATMLVIMSLTSVLVAITLFLAARFHISRLLELLPYPVICGYMAGIAWLLLDAGVYISVDAPISFDLWNVLAQGDNATKLVLAVVGGFALIGFTHRFDQAWALPLASVLIVIGFYGVASLNDMSKSGLVSGGWIYDVQAQSGDVKSTVLGISVADVDFDFIVSVIPQILTIIFLTMLSASLNLSIMSATNPRTKINTTAEMQGLGGGNLLLGIIASPPGYSDAVASSLYEGFGASSRWMALASSGICLLVLFAGTSIISYMPNILICSSIFLFAFQMFYDWMYQNLRSFSMLDYGIVCIILLTVITFGFVEGVIAGVFLTAILFVLRYSMITAIQGQYTLNDHRSSVERGASSNLMLDRYGNESLVCTLRGFLFFGTANAVRDSIRRSIEGGNYATILLDFRRVTGVDISALNTLFQLKEVCEAEGIKVLYSGATKEIEEELLSFSVVSNLNGKPSVFSSTDFAIEGMEEIILREHADETTSGSVHDHLVDILGSADKARLLVDVMERSEFQTGDVLFHQGDSDSGFFILESGSMTATIDIGNGRSLRVKKFYPGSVIGEMSNYNPAKERTASVVANELSVLFHFDPGKLDNFPEIKAASLSAMHELLARTLSARIEYMNRRMALELAPALEPLNQI